MVRELSILERAYRPSGVVQNVTVGRILWSSTLLPESFPDTELGSPTLFLLSSGLLIVRPFEVRGLSHKSQFAVPMV